MNYKGSDGKGPTRDELTHPEEEEEEEDEEVLCAIATEEIQHELVQEPRQRQ